MRPSGTTPVASMITRPKPPSAKRPRCTKCQALAKPCLAEYWHIGATTARLRSVNSRKARGENRRDIRDCLRWGGRQSGPSCFHRQDTMDGKACSQMRVRGEEQPLGRIEVDEGSNGGFLMRHLPLAALAVALLSTSAFAQDSTVLTGKAAFGGWKDDAPGTTRQLTVKDLEEPFVSKSASNSAAPVPMKEGQLPKVPDGYKIELVAKGIDNPRAIRFAPNGDLFVVFSEDGQVLVLRFDGDKPTPVKQSVYVEKLNQPYGIAFYPADKPQWFYVAESDGLKRYPYKEGDLEAPKGNGPDGGAQTILDAIPSEHHWTRDVVFSPDGKTMYFSVGSGSNVGDGTMSKTPKDGLDKWIADHPLGVSWEGEERRAAVLAFAPDGKNAR